MLSRGGKITVEFRNGNIEVVNPIFLRTLIYTGQISRFERSDGWAEIGISKLRGMGGSAYMGPDRRQI